MSDVLNRLKAHFNVRQLYRQYKRRRHFEALVAHIPADATVIVCGGMARSGSTWQFNIVQQVLRELGHEDMGCGWIADLPVFANHKLVMVKSHAYVECLAKRADIVLTCHRDLRDMLASSYRCFKRVPKVEHAHLALEHLAQWSLIADHVMRYEDMLERGKEAVAAEIIRAMLRADDTADRGADGLGGLSPAAIVEAVEALRRDLGRGEKKQQDATSNQLYVNHVTNGKHGQWDGDVAPEVVAGIEQEMGQWLRVHGYMPRRVQIDLRAKADPAVAA